MCSRIPEQPIGSPPPLAPSVLPKGAPKIKIAKNKMNPICFHRESPISKRSGFAPELYIIVCGGGGGGDDPSNSEYSGTGDRDGDVPMPRPMGGEPTGLRGWRYVSTLPAGSSDGSRRWPKLPPPRPAAAAAGLSW